MAPSRRGVSNLFSSNRDARTDDLDARHDGMVERSNPEYPRTWCARIRSPTKRNTKMVS
jgi:hypothetical protein